MVITIDERDNFWETAFHDYMDAGYSLAAAMEMADEERTTTDDEATTTDQPGAAVVAAAADQPFECEHSDQRATECDAGIAHPFGRRGAGHRR